MDIRRLFSPLVGPVVRPYFRLTRGLTLGVRALVFDAGSRVLLVSHTYTPGWHLPGGGVERGETLEEALRRELAEEALIEVRGRPALRGLAANFTAMAGDHVAVFEVRRWRRLETHSGSPGPAALEIRAAAFFAIADLPDGTTGGTRRRIAEAMAGEAVAADW